MNDYASMTMELSETMPAPASRPFALIVDPASIKAAADRVAQLGLPRLVVKAFSEKEKSEDAPRKRSARLR